MCLVFVNLNDNCAWYLVLVFGWICYLRHVFLNIVNIFWYWGRTLSSVLFLEWSDIAPRPSCMCCGIYPSCTFQSNMDWNMTRIARNLHHCNFVFIKLRAQNWTFFKHSLFWVLVIISSRCQTSISLNLSLPCSFTKINFNNRKK